MTKRYQVFISSTFEDLKPARQEVSQALLRAGCFPAGMELFPAADDDQFSYIKTIIDESDYYIIISAGRYGSIHPKAGISFTEMEYDYAVETGKPTIRLLHRDPFNALRGAYIEKTDSGKAMLESFRKKMESARLVRYWSDPIELGVETLHGISDLKARRPAPGWVRGSSEKLSDKAFQETFQRIEGALRVNVDVLMNRLPVPALRIRKNGEIVFANQKAQRLSDSYFKAGESIFSVLESFEKPLLEVLDETLSGQHFTHGVTVKADIGGKKSYFRLMISGVDDLDGSILVVLYDATELKALEEQHIQSQKMQAIGQLAGGIAHDFNNLLTAISGHCDLLLLRHDKGDGDYADLVQINQNANRAASLVGQLLAFSRRQTLQPRIIDVRDVLSDLTHLLNRLVGEKVRLTLSHDPNLPTVRADKRQLEQVIMNLVVNARDAMPRGGEIGILTRKITVKEETTRDRARIPPDDYVVIKVLDEGCGIPRDKIEKVFEPFFTTKRAGEGTGLGLSTAYGIIKQTGGYIFVSSEENKGATFEILLPVVNAKGESDDFQSEAETVPLAPPKGTIVYAEDEASVRAFTARALRLRGYSVVDTESGEEALSILTDSSLEVAAFLSDVVMPGLNGPAWVSEALASRPGTPVLFVSGYAPENFREEIDAIQGARFLSKPYSNSEITANVQLAISRGALRENKHA